MFPVHNLRGLLATPVVRLRPAFTALVLATVTLAAASAAAQSVTVSFEHAEYSVPEGYFPGGSISYSQVNIFLSAAPNTFPDGTFDLDYAGRLVIPLTREMIGGATHGVDFYGASATVQFEPDETTAFLRIFPQADDEDEEGEGVKISFGTAPKGVSIGTPSIATVMFEEPGMPVVNMSPSPATIAENGGVSTVSAWLGYPTDYDVTVTVRVETGDRSSTDDFTLSENRTLTISAGSKWSTGTVTVTAVNNQVDGPDQKPVWVHGSVTGLPGVTDASARTLYIEDDDTLGVTLVLSPPSISENAGVSTVTATLNGAADGDVTVTVAAAPVEPAVANDFTLNGTTLTIEAGETSSTGAVTITARNDDRWGPKSVTVTGAVTGSTNVAAPAPQTLTITDDETTPTLTLKLDPTSISEDGSESSTVTATLSGATLEPVTLTVAAEADSPAVSEDFELTGTTLTLAAGDTQSTGTVTIAAVNNDADAPDRTVTVSAAVTEGPAGLSAPAAQTLTIIDDEEAPTVTLELNPASISEIDGESTVTATLSGPSSEAVTVSVTARPDSPAVSGDFELTGSTLTIKAGDTASTGEVKVTAKDNDLDAPDKRVVIGGTVTGGNGAAAPAPLTLTITDDEDTPTLTLELDPTSISENNGESTVTASLKGLSSDDVVVTVSATAEEPAVANDFRLSVNRELTIRAGQSESTGTVTIAAADNDVDAPDKTFEVTASATGGNGVAAPTAQTLTITDDDGTPTLTLKLEPTSIGENGGRSTVTASLDRPSSESVSVEVSVAPVSPAVDTDFELTGTTLTIGPGDTASTGTVTIAAVNNEVDAPDKTFEVRGAAQGGRGVSDPAVQTLTITDDEDTPEVTLKLDQVSISEDGGVSTVTASLDGLSSADVTVTVSATAVAPAVATDFRLSANRELTITAGQLESTGTVTVSAENNTMDGPNKAIEVAATVSGESGVADPAAQILTIIDDEGAPTVTLKLGSASISENNGETTVTATLSGTSSEAVTVTVSVTAEAPVAAGDFEQAGTTLTIGVGATESTGEVKITARDNAVDAPDKTVEVTGTVTGGNGATAPAPLTLRITDDGDTPTLTLKLDPMSIPENNGETAVTASLDGLSSADVTVTVSAAAVEPAVANDFRLSANRKLTITAGQLKSAGTVTISAATNDVDAPARTVEVTASVEGGNGVAAPAAQTLTITDDDGTPTLTLKLDPTSIGENGGVSTVTASLDRPSSESVTVVVSAAPVSPAVATDFVLVGMTLTIDPGQTQSTGTVTISAANNDVDAPNKTVEVTGSVQGISGVADPAPQTLTITDDEETPRVVLDLSPSTIEEGGHSEVRATLTVPSSEVVKVNVDASSASPSSEQFSQYGRAGAALPILSRAASVPGEGFVLSENRELTIEVGATESEEMVEITALDDTVDGPNRTVEVTGTVTGGNGALPPMPKMLKIMDDDGAPAVTLVLTPARIGEDGGVSTVTATLSPPASEPVTVRILASAVSPAVASDFALSANRDLAIAAGDTQSTGTVTITAVDDTVDNPDKQVTVTGTVSGPSGLVPPSAQTLTITDDDDDEGTVSVSAAVVTVTLTLAPEEIAENGGESRVTAQLSGAAATDVTLTVFAEAVAPADANNFALSANRELTIAAGETESAGMVTLTAVDNTVVNPNRQVTVTASVGGASGVQAPAAQTLTIVDDDKTPTLALVLAPEQITENGGESRVTAQLSGATATDVTLTVSAEAVAPADANDFVLSANRELTIAAGETESAGMVTLTAVDNTVANPNRQVTVTATVGGAPGLEAPAAQTLTIVDDDARNRPPTFFPTSYEFPLEEERDGRTAEVFLGIVKATDPDDQAVTYTLVESDAGRFVVDASSGTVSYVGPGEDAESGVDRYALKVAARDPAGLEAEATVVVLVVPVNEAPIALDDAAETPEDLPRVVDVLANDEDPDGDRLQIVAVTAPRHGTTAVAAGGIRYAPAPGYHGPDAFRYTVADAAGLIAEATVTVDVLPVNDQPEALDDAAQTLEDEPVVVDVLANDSDPDGDSLRVIGVTDPSHGSATVAAGGVRYVPAPDYHGADTFRYTVADPEGLTATATATLTVRPVNDAPEAVGAIPEQTLEEGGAPVMLDLTPYFADVDGDVLTYAAESSDPAAATVTVAGTTLTLTAVVAGAARVTVTASDPAGLTATQVFGVAVGDRLVRAVLTDTLAALGRGHLSNVVPVVWTTRGLG